MQFRYLLIVVFSLATLGVNAQTEKQSSGSINQQLDSILIKSRNYGNYKAVNVDILNKFQDNLKDSLNRYYNEITSLTSQNEQQVSENAELLSENESLKEELVDSNSRIDSISFLGIQFSKSTYNIIVWSLIIGLIAVLVFGLVNYINMISSSKHCKEEAQKIEKELHDLREKKLENEIQLKRKLQTAINKLDDHGVNP